MTATLTEQTIFSIGELQLGCVQCLVSSRGTRGLQAFATHCCSPLVFGFLQVQISGYKARWRLSLRPRSHERRKN